MTDDCRRLSLFVHQRTYEALEEVAKERGMNINDTIRLGLTMVLRVAEASRRGKPVGIPRDGAELELELVFPQ